MPLHPPIFSKRHVCTEAYLTSRVDLESVISEQENIITSHIIDLRTEYTPCLTLLCGLYKLTSILLMQMCQYKNQEFYNANVSVQV